MYNGLLDCVEINPGAKASFTVIWLHGLGADGHDFEPIVPALRLPENIPVRFVFPHAPERPVTINGGMVMRAWYDIVEMNLSRNPDIEGIRESAELLKNLVQREIDSGMSPEKILLAGFSQGGAVVLHAALRYEKSLAGVLALSTYSPTIDALKDERSEANRNVPVLMAHGKFDPVIPIQLGLETRRRLDQLEYPVLWHEYPMEHQVCMEEIEAIGAWMSDILK